MRTKECEDAWSIHSSHCKCVGGSGKNSNELVKAEAEEQAETSLQLKDRVSPGLTVITVGVWAGEPRLGSSSAKIIPDSHQPTGCESTSSSSQHQESNCISWGWTERKKKGEAILPICSGPQPHVHFGELHLQSLQRNQEDLGLASLENRRHFEVGL